MKWKKVQEILACPQCLGDLLIEEAQGKITCKACWTPYRMEGRVPLMLPDLDGGSVSREARQANPYAPGSLEMIERHADGLILDDGAGSNRTSFSHVIQLDRHLSPSTDVVADHLHLPFRGEAFSAVISEAVIGGVRDPFRYTSEIHRVLKEGGEVRIDAPFLQPLHAAPQHYFNMTRSGLEMLLEAFENVQSGVGPHQEPWVVLRDLLGTYAAALQDPELQRNFLGLKVGDLLNIVREEKELAPLRLLRKEMMEYIAAGVFLHGVKRKKAKSPRTSRPAVSVVVVDSGDGRNTGECLERIAGLSHPMEKLEVILVDGASGNGALPIVRRRFPRVKIVEAGRDVGTPGARMMGAREATGKYVAFLDAACRVEKDWLDALLGPIDEKRKIVCTASRVSNGEGEGIAAIPGGMDFLGRPAHPDTDPSSDGTSPPEGPALYPLGSGMLIDREAFFKAGGFDAEYIDSLDDLDLGWRLWVLGYEVHHAPGAPVHRSVPKEVIDPARRVRLLERNALRSLYKNYEESTLQKILPTAILLTLQRGWGHSRISVGRYLFGSPEDGDFGEEKVSAVHAAHLLAVDRFLQELPALEAQRAAIQRARLRPDEEIFPMFRPPNEEGQEYREVFEGLVRTFDLQQAAAGSGRGDR